MKKVFLCSPDKGIERERAVAMCELEALESTGGIEALGYESFLKGPTDRGAIQTCLKEAGTADGDHPSRSPSGLTLRRRTPSERPPQAIARDCASAGVAVVDGEQSFGTARDLGRSGNHQRPDSDEIQHVAVFPFSRPHTRTYLKIKLE
jgi:hypothetical protein